MNRRAGLKRARRAAERNMSDRCKVERPTGAAITDQGTGKVTRAMTLIYPVGSEDGRCEVKQSEGQANTPSSGGYRFTAQGSVVKLPVGAGPGQVNDVITMLESAFDPNLPGTVYRVVEIAKATAASSQRLRVEEITG